MTKTKWIWVSCSRILHESLPTVWFPPRLIKPLMLGGKKFRKQIRGLFSAESSPFLPKALPKLTWSSPSVPDEHRKCSSPSYLPPNREPDPGCPLLTKFPQKVARGQASCYLGNLSLVYVKEMRKLRGKRCSRNLVLPHSTEFKAP